MHEVARAFELGQVRASHVVMRGAMGEISRVETDRGSFAVKELFAWNTGDAAEQEAVVTAFARTQGLSVPNEIRTPAGSLVAQLEGVRWRAYEWFELDHNGERAPELVGAALATLHRHAVPDSRPLDPWYAVAPSPDRWRRLVLEAADEPWGTAFADLLPHLLDLGSLQRQDQPRFTCHRDFVASNVMPLTSGGLAVLDWENAGPLELEQELAYVLLWCPNALDAYVTTMGEAPPRLTPESYATAACTWLNFLDSQAEAALDPVAQPAHLEFARTVVATALANPMVVPGG